MEAAICCEDATAGSRIISWRRYGSGFEWIGPSKDSKTQRYYSNNGGKNVGKELEVDKWYVIALQYEPFEEEVEGEANKKKKIRIRSFINHELDGEEIVDCGYHLPNL